jgi:hypothetical protein
VTSLHGLPLHIVNPLPPDSQGVPIPFVEGIEWSADSPQMQQRSSNVLQRRDTVKALPSMPVSAPFPEQLRRRWDIPSL